MFPFSREAAGYEFKPSLHLNTDEAFHQENEGVKIIEFNEAIIKVILILLLLRRLETLILRPVPVREDVSVHDKHAVNTVHSFLPEVAEEKISLLLKCIQSHGWSVVK